MKTLEELMAMVDKCMFEAAYPSATTSPSTLGVEIPIANAKAELESALRDLIADAERLDWMQSTETTPWRITHQEWHLRTDGSNGRYPVEVFEGWSVSSHDEPHLTIRAAIDAARKG